MSLPAPIRDVFDEGHPILPVRTSEVAVAEPRPAASDNPVFARRVPALRWIAGGAAPDDGESARP
ncbi:MAG: hypothetical protein ACQGVK_08380 [Myxococcota bacterium]